MTPKPEHEMVPFTGTALTHVMTQVNNILLRKKKKTASNLKRATDGISEKGIYPRNDINSRWRHVHSYEFIHVYFPFGNLYW